MKNYGTLRYFKNAWIVECDPHVLIRMRRVFPRISQPKYQEGKKRELICITDTPEVCRDLQWFISRFPLTFADKASEILLEKQASDHLEEEQVVELILDDKHTPPEFKLALPARTYQRIAAELALRTRGLLIGDSMGLGKTISAICTLTDTRTLPALIVTKTALPKQWESQIKRFAPWLRVHIVKGTRPYNIAKQSGGQVPHVIIISYSKLHGWGDYLSGRESVEGTTIRVASAHYDECQEFRNGEDTYKGKAAMKISKRAIFRTGLSGTPFLNLGGELWNVMEFIRPGALGTLREFKTEHCVGDASTPGKMKLKDPRAMGAHLRDAGLMIRRTKEDVGRQLPKLTRIPHYIDYEQKELDAVDEQATALARTILSKTETTRGARMQAGGKLDALLRQATGVSKAAAAADFVRMIVEGGETVLCFAYHHKVYDIFREKLKDLNPVFFTGDESPNEKEKSLKAFMSGETKVLVMSLRSGEGLDGLQFVCNNVVYAELDFSPGIHEQNDCRIYRDGQLLPVFSYFLLADGGSDPILSDILGVKRAQLEGVRDLKVGGDLPQEVDVDRMRKVAQAYLDKKAKNVRA